MTDVKARIAANERSVGFIGLQDQTAVVVSATGCAGQGSTPLSRSFDRLLN
jgi:hypothetical protein